MVVSLFILFIKLVHEVTGLKQLKYSHNFFTYIHVFAYLTISLLEICVSHLCDSSFKCKNRLLFLV